MCFRQNKISPPGFLIQYQICQSWPVIHKKDVQLGGLKHVRINHFLTLSATHQSNKLIKLAESLLSQLVSVWILKSEAKLVRTNSAPSAPAGLLRCDQHQTDCNNQLSSDTLYIVHPFFCDSGTCVSPDPSREHMPSSKPSNYFVDVDLKTFYFVIDTAVCFIKNYDTASRKLLR